MSSPSPGSPSVSSSQTNSPVGTRYMQEAKVTNGTITPTDNLAKYANVDNLAIFTDYIISNRYEYDRATYMAGLTSSEKFEGQSVAFFQLCSPTLLWACDWTAARLGVQPQIPSPDIEGNDWVLLDVLPEAGMITVLPDGNTPLYRISGTYYYGHKNPSPKVFDQISFGRPPWLQDVFSRTMPLNSLVQGLSTSVTGTGTTSSPGSPGTAQ